jgi:hypothetical protein
LQNSNDRDSKGGIATVRADYGRSSVRRARGAIYYYNSNVYYFGEHMIISLALVVCLVKYFALFSLAVGASTCRSCGVGDNVPIRLRRSRSSGGTWYSFVPIPGTGEIHTDPLFKDFDNNDFGLTETSPCRGAGEGGKDIGGKPYPTAITPTSFGKVKALFN